MLIRFYSGSDNIFERRGRLARQKATNWIFKIVSGRFYWCKINQHSGIYEPTTVYK